jgi:hypothetical protein
MKTVPVIFQVSPPSDDIITPPQSPVLSTFQSDPLQCCDSRVRGWAAEFMAGVAAELMVSVEHVLIRSPTRLWQNVWHHYRTKVDSREACCWITGMTGFNPSNIMNFNSTRELQHPNHELCHRTDDVTKHHEPQ